MDLDEEIERALERYYLHLSMGGAKVGLPMIEYLIGKTPELLEEFRKRNEEIRQLKLSAARARRQG